MPAITELKCFRCNHEWIPRTSKVPMVCPRCKSYEWAKDFRDEDEA